MQQQGQLQSLASRTCGTSGSCSCKYRDPRAAASTVTQGTQGVVLTVLRVATYTAPCCLVQTQLLTRVTVATAQHREHQRSTVLRISVHQLTNAYSTKPATVARDQYCTRATVARVQYARGAVVCSTRGAVACSTGSIACSTVQPGAVQPSCEQRRLYCTLLHVKDQ